MANKYQKPKSLRLFDQMIALRATYPSSICEIRGDTLWWHGKIQPTPISKEYSVIMTYKLWKSPSVWVIGEELQKLDDPEFPHRYKKDEKNQMVRICLYRYAEFSSKKFLAKTIIPWAVEWLYFYEIWLTTGEWCGGGEHPDFGKCKDDSFEDERL